MINCLGGDLQNAGGGIVHLFSGVITETLGEDILNIYSMGRD